MILMLRWINWSREFWSCFNFGWFSKMNSRSVFKNCLCWNLLRVADVRVWLLLVEDESDQVFLKNVISEVKQFQSLTNFKVFYHLDRRLLYVLLPPLRLPNYLSTWCISTPPADACHMSISFSLPSLRLCKALGFRCRCPSDLRLEFFPPQLRS